MQARQGGMSLVELMVGIAVGLLVVIAASGSLSFFEGQRNTSLSGNAAMNSGVMAGYLLQRDLRNAGVGLMNATQLACNKLNVYYSGATKADGLPVAPVLISDGGAGPDSVSIFFAASVLGSAPVELTRGLTAAGDTLRVNSTSGLQQGDVVLIASSNGTDPCSVAQLSAVTPTGTAVDLARAAGASYPFNPADPATAFTTAPLYPAGGAVLRTGSGITWRSYSVDNTNALIATDRITGNTIKVATNVLSMQAQYGVTDGISNEIRQWVDATNEWDATTAPLDAAHVSRIRAVRFSVIVRSAKKELARDAGGACTTTTAAPQPWPDAAPMDLSANPDWGCYRYQVYASIAPLKNVVWSVSQ
ncbi:MAG TPA: PilW family protein [Burkholderiales bacterium]|nr:PilW family protein [Burkholderiales bacterium]